jgi:predicted O-methyltransferase YrrM
MHELEELDAHDRGDGTPNERRLRQVPPETGRFLSLLGTMAPSGNFIEIGTSAGYSTLWLSLAAAPRGIKITTFEVLPHKAKLARETFQATSLTHTVRLVEADARAHLALQGEIAFCFLDAEKDIYSECYELIVPHLLPGGILVADNVISHHEVLSSFVARALGDDRVDALVVPIGSGVLVCRRA